MKTYPRQKLYDVGHRQFFGSWVGGRLNDGQGGDFVARFGAFLETGQSVVPLSRGRLGIYFAVKHAVQERRKRVLMSPFTAFDVVNMAICAGGEPVFLDSDPDSPHVSLKTIEEAQDDRTAAVIVTHYHTSNPEIEAIAQAGSHGGAVLIEDCAIGLGGRPGGVSAGLHGDFGIFSFGLFKFIATYFGGAIVVKDPAVAANIQAEMAGWPPMDGADLRPYLIKGLKLDTLTHPMIFPNLTFPLFRFGYVNGIDFIKKQAVGDPSPVYRETLPETFRRRPSDFQKREWVRQLPKVLENRKRRLENARIYHAELFSSNAIVCPPAPDDRIDCYLSYPVLVADRDRILQELMKRGFDASQHFYRNCADMEFFRKHGDGLPNLEALLRRVLLLPTYPSVPTEYAKNLSHALKEVMKNQSN